MLCAAFFYALKNTFKKVCTIKIVYLNLCTQLKIQVMKYFLRYTATPEADLERGTSLHLCDGPEQEGSEMIDGIGWAVVLNGLCAHDVDADNEEEAIEEAISSVLWARKNSGASGNYPEGDGYAAYLFEGSYSDEDCDDGVMFHPKRIIANISILADEEA